jgi:mannose-6-phosphate isomerase
MCGGLPRLAASFLGGIVEEPYVLQTTPLLVEKIWGGHRLARTFGKSLQTGMEHVGEAWEVADLVEGESAIANGPLAGQSLHAAVDLWGADLVGTASVTQRFPLLVKLLDARDDLSVQVHPGHADLHHFEGAQSKDESWVIVEADPGASILHGLRPGVDTEMLRRGIESGSAVECLRRVEVNVGDVFRVAPGTVHAICAGVCLLEIQEPSDTTFRVYDYDRPGLDGGLRELHVDQAMRIIRCDRQENSGRRRISDDIEVLVDVAAYRIERLTGHCPLVWKVNPASVQVVHVISGCARIDGLHLRRGDTIICPASLGRVHVEQRDPDAVLVVAGLGGYALVDAES